MVAKQPHDFLRLAEAQQAVIDEDASEPLADRFMDEHRRDGRIDAAGEAAQHAPRCRPARGWRRSPRRRNAAIVQSDLSPATLWTKFDKQPRAVRRVRDFEMKLHAVIAPRLVGDRRQWRVFGTRDRVKTFRQSRHAVAMAHPYRIFACPFPIRRRTARCPARPPPRRGRIRAGARPRPCPRTARHELLAIANGEHRHARVEDRPRRARRPVSSPSTDRRRE